MAFSGNYTCDTFKYGLLTGGFNFLTDTLFIALYTDAATLNSKTTAYTPIGEASGGSYSAGGQTLTTTLTSFDNTVCVNFSNVSWQGPLTARGALIYKPGTNGAVCVLDFGSTKTAANYFTVTMPADRKSVV